MWLWGNSAKLAKKKSEEAFYEEAFREIASNRIRPGIWAKVFSDAQGNREKAEALYVERRAEDIALEANARRDELLRQEREQKRIAHTAQANAERLVKEAEKVERERKKSENTKVLTFLTLCIGFSLFGLEVFNRTQSITLGIAYGVVLFMLPISLAQAGKRMPARYTLAVVLSALYLAVANWVLNVETGPGLFWTALLFFAVAFGLLMTIRRVKH